MNAAPQWSTASFGEAAETTPVELAALGEHLAACSDGRGHLHALRCVAQRVQAFVFGRLVTTSLLLVALIGFLALVL